MHSRPRWSAPDRLELSRLSSHLLVPLFVSPIPVLLLASTITLLLQGVLCCLPEESDIPVCKERGVSLDILQTLPKRHGKIDMAS